MQTGQGQQTLWSLPYDTDSVFKPFLKIPFSYYLNQLISNQHFPEYQAAMGRQIKDKSVWNEKCWVLLQFFEFLNTSFDIGVWDSRIDFIEDNHLRNIMGCFRLWIDTERLYLLNFLKLDSTEFQEDRIFMALFRTLLFMDNLFNDYHPNDFDATFLQNFLNSCLGQLELLAQLTTKETAQIIAAVVALLVNLKNKKKILIEHNTLQSIRKSATIKVTKEAEVIQEVENRLLNSVLFKCKIDEEARLKQIIKTQAIDDVSAGIRDLYDPIFKLEKDFDIEFYGPAEEKERRRKEGLEEEIREYKAQVKGHARSAEGVYQTIEKSGNNPYSLKNYQLFGEMVKIDMNERSRYQQEKVAEVASLEDNDRSKFFYQESFTQQLEAEHNKKGSITEADVSRYRGRRKQEEYKNQHENTRVFNLRWHLDPNASQQSSNKEHTSKDYDNNLLFKSPLEEQMLDHKRTKLDKLKEVHGCNSYTIALLEQQAEEILGAPSCQGTTLFVNRTPFTLDTRRFKLLNQNKFDFMRKVLGYMAGQKKIQKAIALKPVPELYPRNLSECRQLPYDPTLTDEKVRIVLGEADRGRVFL